MKRKAVLDKEYKARHGSVRLDLDPDQLQCIGAIAMAYNELEATIDNIFLIVTNLGETLGAEVSTRINGIDGKIAIIKEAIKPLPFEEADRNQIQVALGEGGFGLLKKHRDAVIHARVLNTPKAIGFKVDRRASTVEVLLTAAALEALEASIVALQLELIDASMVISILKKKLSPSERDSSAFIEAMETEFTKMFRAHVAQKKALPRLPDFPSNEEVRKAYEAWHAEQQARMVAALRRLSASQQTNVK